jgi:hypothetical protein
MATTAPASTSAEPAATLALSTTQIKLADRTIELRGLTVEQGQIIYDALPPHYKAMADNYASIAKNYERALKINLPQGMSFDQAFQHFTEAMKTGVDFASEKTATYLKEFNQVFGNIPAISALRTTTTAVGNLSSALGGATSAASDILGIPGAILNVSGLMLTEMFGAIKPSISDGQARAFGAALAGAALHENAVRQGMPLIANPLTGEKSIVFENMGEATAAGAEHATTSIPILSDVWSYIVAAGKLVMSYFSKDPAIKNLSFMERWNHSLAEARSEQTARQPDLTYEQRLEARLAAGEIKRAAAKVERAEVVAGLSTKDYVAATTVPNVHVGQDGKTTVVTLDAQGQAKASSLKAPDGSEVGRIDRIVAETGDIAPGLQEVVKEGNGYAMTGYAAGAGALAGAEYRWKPIRRLSNLGVSAATSLTQTASAIGTGLASVTVRAATAVTGWVLPNSEGPQKYFQPNQDKVDATVKAVGNATRVAAEKAGKSADEITKLVATAEEAAKKTALTSARPLHSRAVDFLRPVGDGVQAGGKYVRNLLSMTHEVTVAATDVIKTKLQWDVRSSAQKAADEIAKKTLVEAVPVTAPVVTAAPAPVVTAAAAPATATAAAQPPVAAATAAPAKTAGTGLMGRVRELGQSASALLRGARSKWLVGGAALAGAGAASAQGQSVVAGASSFASDITGLSDVKRGDPVRGAAVFSNLFTRLMVSPVEAVDNYRLVENLRAIDSGLVEQLSRLVSANSAASGNEYLKRVAQLKEMQARGVSHVTVSGALSQESIGKFLYEGKPIHSHNPASDVMTVSGLPATIAEMIDTNLRLYLATGGTIEQARAMLAPTGTLPADPALSAAVVAQQTRAAAVAAAVASPEAQRAIGNAQMAINRGAPVVFGKVSSAKPGSFVAPATPPMQVAEHQLSAFPAA